VMKWILRHVGLAVALLLIGGIVICDEQGFFAHAQVYDTKNSVRALALGPEGGLYIGTFGNGIFYSPDQGVHWEKMSQGLGDPFILTIVAGTGKDIFACTVRKGIFRTTDGGRHWEAVNAGLGNVEVPVLLARGSTLYAGTGKGVYRSTNRGQQWEAYNTGIERILVRSMIMDPNGVLFAGTAGRGLYQRVPKSHSWEQLARGFGGAKRRILENFIRILTLGPDGTIYAGTFDGGVYISRDGGKQWDPFSNGLKNQSIRALIVRRDKTVYVGTGKGIFVRKPSDDQWRSISQDLKDDVIQSMVVDESGQIYAGTTLGLYKGTVDGGWTEITPGFSKI
jgi:ligand-binding sensor domain-containing protein